MNILIFGSCVTRDAFRLQEGLLQSGSYFARSSLGSAFSNRVRFNVDLEKITSNFQRKMVENDLNKRFARSLPASKFDLLIYDPIDERFNLLVDTKTNSVCTLSSEFNRSGFQRTSSNLKVIHTCTEEHYNYWERGWQKFVSLLTEMNGLGRLRINEVYWSTETQSRESYEPQYHRSTIENANIFLDRLYSRMRVDLPPQQFYQFPKEVLLGADSHLWGKSPFHYIDEYYQQLMSH